MGDQPTNESDNEGNTERGPPRVTLIEPVKFHPGEWDLEHAPLSRAAGDSDTLTKFNRDYSAIQDEVLGHERRYREGCGSIGLEVAEAISRRFRDLYEDEAFDARKDYVSDLCGQCLALGEGWAGGKVYGGQATLQERSPSGVPPRTHRYKLAIPVELPAIGVDLPFGVETHGWLSYHLKLLIREHAKAASPPSSGYWGFFDDGDIWSMLFPELTADEPPEGSLSVVPVRNETTIREFIPRAVSSTAHRDALKNATAMLLRFRQPLGDTLSDWLADVLDGRAEKTDGRSTRDTRKALRDTAIVKALEALRRCGMTATRNEATVGRSSACDAVAAAFGLGYDAVVKVRSNHKSRWKVIRR